MTECAPIRYGVLGAANIARSFAKGLAGSRLAEVAAVASRGQDKAAAFAAECGIPRHHASYAQLLADPEIDAIYIPLPNTMHAEWAIRAAEAGKHILCEKPLSMSGGETRAMFAAAHKHGVLLAEAYPYMSQRQTLQVREWIAEGAIGRVQLINAAFCFALVSPEGEPLRDPGNIRLDPAMGGGGLLDAGTYAMSMVRIAAGERPSRAFAAGRFTKNGVDQSIMATLEFPSGIIAQITSSLGVAGYRQASILGESGVIETSYRNHGPEDGGPLPLAIRRSVVGTQPPEIVNVPAEDGFRAEAESFARAIRQGPSHWNGASEAESLDITLSLVAIAESARSGKWVDIVQG
jgi:predicted dehydrogenase